MKNITVSEFRDLLDSHDLTYKKNGDTFIVPLDDDEVGEKIGVIFSVSSDRLQSKALIPDFGSKLSETKKLRFCNAWNRDKVYPKAYLDRDEDFVLEMTIFQDAEISGEYIRQYFILLNFVATIQFFRDLKEKL